MQYGNGDVYEGQWRDGQPNGDGIYVHEGGVLIREGQFRDGLLHGQGKVLGGDGPNTIYQGEFQKVCLYRGRAMNGDLLCVKLICCVLFKRVASTGTDRGRSVEKRVTSPA